MIKFLGYILIIILVVILSICAYFYIWAAGLPEQPKETYTYYQNISMVLAIMSIYLIITGIYRLVSLIKKENKRYREQQHENEDMNITFERSNHD